MLSPYIKQQLAVYDSLTPIFCPTLQETVYFTSEGKNHLLYKKNRPRNHNERHYRVAFIKHLIHVLVNAEKAIKTIIVKEPKEIVTWSLECKVTENSEDMVVKVICKKEGNGKIKFLSVMGKRIQKNLGIT